jgi:hypothetical protein
MGMFDNVMSEVPLPDGYDGPCQTKDFDDPYLETYLIRADGRLIHEPDKPNGRGDTNFHGVLNFYAYAEGGVWHEYDAKFTDGQLVGISLVPDSDQ